MKPTDLPKQGTSPRTRGKRLRFTDLLQQRRNIPAHAGKTYLRTCRCGWLPEHPRARGENPAKRATLDDQNGTSPRTRGKRSAHGYGQWIVRNIPAHAGKTVYVHQGHGPNKEHPRARGENQKPSPGTKRKSGTSPRTRGKPTCLTHHHHLARNIPAHAGKTYPHPGRDWANAEHPRARGENLMK